MTRGHKAFEPDYRRLHPVNTKQFYSGPTPIVLEAGEETTIWTLTGKGILKYVVFSIGATAWKSVTPRIYVDGERISWYFEWTLSTARRRGIEKLEGWKIVGYDPTGGYATVQFIGELFFDVNCVFKGYNISASNANASVCGFWEEEP